MTDEEKRRKYPEWKLELYKKFPLIVQELQIKSVTRKVGDFSTKGCYSVGIDNNALVCKCNHLSDFAIREGGYPNATGPTVIAIPYSLYSPSRSVSFILFLFLFKRHHA